MAKRERDGTEEKVEKPKKVISPIASEFYAWLLFQSEARDETFMVPGVGSVSVLVQDRLAFESNADKAKAVITGDEASSSAETRAALISGKVLTDIKLLLRLEATTYMLNLRGNLCDICSLKQVNEDLEPVANLSEEGDSKEATLLLRMVEYEDIWKVLQTLFREFAKRRTDKSWYTHELQDMKTWVHDTE